MLIENQVSCTTTYMHKFYCTAENDIVYNVVKTVSTFYTGLRNIWDM